MQWAQRPCTEYNELMELSEMREQVRLLERKVESLSRRTPAAKRKASPQCRA